MRILLANKFFFNKGGAERVMFQERTGLMEQGVSVVDFSMLDERNEPSPFSDHFLSHRDFAVPPVSLVQRLRLAINFVHCREAIRKLTRLANFERPDIVHLHNIYHHFTPAIIPALKRLGIKVVLTLHDYKLVCPAYVMLDSNGNVCRKCEPRRFYKPFTTNCQGSRAKGLLLAAEACWQQWLRLYDGVDAFIAPSAFMRDTVTRHILPQRKVQIIPNGIEVDRFQPTGELGEYALYIGRLSREKGIPALLEAHKQLSARHGTAIPFKVVGTGPEEARLREQYPHAEFLGHRTWNEVLSLMDTARFVAVPSAWYENCPMVVLEAMCMARPVLGSDMGGIPELIEDGVTGLLHRCNDTQDIADKMASLWQQPDHCLEMGRAARRRAEEHYSLDAHMQRLLSLYERVLSKPAR